MKTALAMMAVAAMVAAGGCNKKNEPEMPEDYGNACIVGHPLCSAQVRHAEPPDEAVAADQAKAVGGRTVVPGPAGVAIPATPPAPASSEPDAPPDGTPPTPADGAAAAPADGGAFDPVAGD